MGHPSEKIAYTASFQFKVWFETTKRSFLNKNTSPVNEEMLRKALKEHMEDGKSIRAAAEDNNIPRETLTQWAKNPPSHFGSDSKKIYFIN